MERLPSVVLYSRCFYASLAIWLAFYLTLVLVPQVQALVFLQGLLLVVTLMAYWQAAATFMFWQSESARIVSESTASGADSSPKSVWWWLCPVANFWMPLVEIIRLWERTGVQGHKWVLGVWWVLLIAGWMTQGFVLAGRGAGAESLGLMGIASYLLAGLCAVYLVFRITRAVQALESPHELAGRPA